MKVTRHKFLLLTDKMVATFNEVRLWCFFPPLETAAADISEICSVFDAARA